MLEARADGRMSCPVSCPLLSVFPWEAIRRRRRRLPEPVRRNFFTDPVGRSGVCMLLQSNCRDRGDRTAPTHAALGLRSSICVDYSRRGRERKRIFKGQVTSMIQGVLGAQGRWRKWPTPVFFSLLLRPLPALGEGPHPRAMTWAAGRSKPSPASSNSRWGQKDSQSSLMIGRLIQANPIGPPRFAHCCGRWGGGCSSSAQSAGRCVECPKSGVQYRRVKPCSVREDVTADSSHMGLLWHRRGDRVTSRTVFCLRYLLHVTALREGQACNVVGPGRVALGDPRGIPLPAGPATSCWPTINGRYRPLRGLSKEEGRLLRCVSGSDAGTRTKRGTSHSRDGINEDERSRTRGRTNDGALWVLLGPALLQSAGERPFVMGWGGGGSRCAVAIRAAPRTAGSLAADSRC
ncbi:hypothetical protein HPB51_014514 [Rhipicephalus microplus]|uniref:Uncharacterized protein n=1 Tax=Rhipicephalus microplus TaxID=6941 RepID=A0A9J6EHV1_RHIMP|nr:hypothetical protein HPB51_014514 [Rhipicephalus microplus]